MEKNFETLCDKVIEMLSKDKDNLDKSYVIVNGKQFSKNNLIKSITEKTKIGLNFVNNLIILSLDLFDRDKKDLINFQKSSDIIKLTKDEITTLMDDSYHQTGWSDSSYKIISFIGLDPTAGV